jgi:hypothetical protein
MTAALRGSRPDAGLLPGRADVVPNFEDPANPPHRATAPAHQSHTGDLRFASVIDRTPALQTTAQARRLRNDGRSTPRCCWGRGCRSTTRRPGWSR